MSELENKNWEQILDYLCDHNEEYTDVQFAERFQLACLQIPSDKEVTHQRTNLIIQKRVEDYCNETNITVENYDGVLPFRFNKNAK